MGCDMENWREWWPGFRGQCGLRGCKLVLQFPRTGEPAHGLDLQVYDKQSDLLHSLLCVACAQNTEATSILELHSGTLGGLDDGKSAITEIKELCQGGAGMTTIEGLLASMESLEGCEFDSVRELAAHHQHLFTKVRDLTITLAMEPKDFV